METRNDILNELKAIAPRLASIEKKNLYEAPEGYFERFRSDILEQVKMNPVQSELKNVAPSLLNIEKKTAAIPDGYFNTFSADLLKKIRSNETATELSAIAPTLAQLEKVNTQQVPANYFAQFPAQMAQLIAQQQPATEESVMPKWIQSVNIVLENITAVVFKPKYSFAFAGTFTVVVMAVMMFNQAPVQQPCADFLCMANSISSTELDEYLNSRVDVGNEVFELNETEATEPVVSSGDNMKDAMSTLSDEELNEVVLD